MRELSERHDAIVRELNEERIAALTRISRTLESLIEQLHALRSNRGACTREEYDRLRSRAKQYRWFLEVQREALGLRHHLFLDRFYAIPGPLADH